MKYHPSIFDNDEIFILSPLPLGVPFTYICGMDGMDKSMMATLGIPQKQPTSIMNMGCHSSVHYVQVICNAQMTSAIISFVMKVIKITLSRHDSLQSLFV